jgi:hypothetical protein
MRTAAEGLSESNDIICEEVEASITSSWTDHGQNLILFMP